MLVALAIGIALVTGGFAVGGKAAAAEAPARAVEYVGTAGEVEAYVDNVPQRGAFFVAVAIDKSKKVDAYVCDGFGSFDLFSGTEQDGKIDLQSADGSAQLTATVNDSRITGQLSIAGAPLSFTLKKAKSVGGLYTVKVKQSADGTVSATGSSVRDNKFSSKRKPDGRRVPVTVTTVNDGTRKLSLRPQEVQPPQELLGLDSYRIVLLDTGMGRGNPTINATQLTSATQLGAATLRTATTSYMIPWISP